MKNLTSVFLFLFTIQVHGSIPKNKPSIEQILSQTNTHKFSTLKKMGPEVYKELRKLTFDESRTLGIRWQAFMAMVRLGEKEAIPEVKEALNSSDWFLRDAAIRVLPALDKEVAYKAAIKGLDDSALVVRTTAVDTLGRLGKKECADKLWTALYSKDNYIRNQSLWIRKHIVSALADLALPGSEAKFIKVLDDSDSTLFAPAIAGLERLTGKKLGETQIPPVYRRYYWKKWYKETVSVSKAQAS
ncbi:MAG: HEAT repeat domain-containing protein [Oligoflexia bacterium]|nr:HEAT repeat domain-containing protein [Oligoflexia bacterium]